MLVRVKVQGLNFHTHKNSNQNLAWLLQNIWLKMSRFAENSAKSHQISSFWPEIYQSRFRFFQTYENTQISVVNLGCEFPQIFANLQNFEILTPENTNSVSEFLKNMKSANFGSRKIRKWVIFGRNFPNVRKWAKSGLKISKMCEFRCRNVPNAQIRSQNSRKWRFCLKKRLFPIFAGIIFL